MPLMFCLQATETDASPSVGPHNSSTPEQINNSSIDHGVRPHTGSLHLLQYLQAGKDALSDRVHLSDKLDMNA